ncbi:MAG TPA: type II toxin-antitoxin system VapC family toxin [Gemmataceae bacterium]|nr:type II toxin-antitoxin system VapC family toxin [Gemmataceae bacterium]
MRYAVDASVSLKWGIQEPDSAKADALRQDYVSGVHDLIAPDICPVEVAHVLTRAERRKIIAVGQALPLLADIMSTAPTLHSYLSLLNRATALSSRTQQGVYDCLYVALAEAEGCELVTADAKLLRKLAPAFPFIISLASLP